MYDEQTIYYSKAYEFMKQLVIEGRSMLDKFLEWLGEKVRDVRGM